MSESNKKPSRPAPPDRDSGKGDQTKHWERGTAGTRVITETTDTLKPRPPEQKPGNPDKRKR